ncbi:MAG: fibronectin type III domain-containing protein, partial [Crocinitomicaceae bacterium]|nr:fibronectin type III domain-containing protein [Crocinitomicaceae bacterium]
MRRLYIFRVLVVALLLVLGKNVSAQTYTVQTTLIPSGPHYNYLSHLADQNNHLQVMLTLLDFNTAPINVRLRVRIEGPGYVLYTNPNISVGQPFTLESGIPLFLTDLDLQPYLHQNNLIVSPSGLDINNLPEGYTSVCVDVILDGTNQEVISSNNCTGFQLTRFQPSLLSFPICESVIDTNEMFLTCQWTDPIGYVPDGNSYIEHTFTLHRWFTPNNYSIFQSGQGFVTEVVTAAPMVNIPLIDLQLETGGLYIWRVQSRIFSNNGIQLQMIENSGISLPCTFHFGEPQTLADVLTDGLFIDLNATSTTDIKGKAWWTVVDNTPNQGLDSYDKYLVEYRRQPTGNESYQIPWISDTIIDTLDFIYQLEPSTTYEVKVSGIVGNNISDPTPVKTFTTQDPREYACGDTDMPYLPYGWMPLENAQAGIQVQIGQFMLHTTQLQAVGGTGHYSGKGTIPIPFLMGAKAKVTFDDILIDTEYMVREGRADVITQGLENWLHEQYGQFVDPIYVNGVIDSAWVDSTGVAWAMVDGVAYEYPFDPPTYPIILNDENGNQYTIYPNDSIEVTSYVAISENWAVDPDEVAMFSQNANENRGFDPKEHMQWHENYEIMRLADSTLYFVANKSMAEGESDVVNVELPQGTQASFQLADGTPISSIPFQGTWMGTPKYQNGAQFKLTLPVMPSAGNYSMHVFANNKKVGEMNIVVYSEKQKEVIVVPLVANLSVDDLDIKNKLDATLGEANINVNVTLAPQWNDTLFTPTKSISLPTEVGILTKYSEEMRDLRDAYFASNPSANKDAYYLFMVHSFENSSELGYMVRGRGMGFIRAAQTNVLNTIAHELGHGIGALEHTWKHNGPDKDSTSNLLDYGTFDGNLIREQWTEMRNINLLPSLFDAAEDGLYGFEEYVNFYQDTKTAIPINSNHSNSAFYLLNGEPYKFQQSGLKSIDSVIFDRLGRVFAFKTQDFEYYEALITRTTGGEVPLSRSYLTIPEIEEYYGLSNGTGLLSSPQLEYLSNHGYQFVIPTSSDSVYSRSCL